jgi:hypothetical protein
LPLPLVVPIVLHHSERGWTQSTRLEQLLDPAFVGSPELSPLVPHLSFVLDDISHLSDEALRERALGLLPTLALWALRDGRQPDRLLSSLVYWARLLGELSQAPSGRDALTTIFRYLSLVADLSADTFYTVVQSHAPEAKEALMTLAEQWKAEGRAAGRAEGEAKAKAADILAVLEARQKAVTAEQRARVEACTDLAQLDRWLRRAATLNDTRELFERPE